MSSTSLVISVFGTQAIQEYSNQAEMLSVKAIKQDEANSAREKASQAFKVDISTIDVLVAGIAGSLAGIANGLFKNCIPRHGNLKHICQLPISRYSC